MDYETKPTSRLALREYSKYFRKLFDVPLTGSFPVLEALDKIGDIFYESNYMIVDDNVLPPQTMAQCSPNTNGGFTIEIKESVYDGAYKNIGAFRGFICHEICHIFLFAIGFSPIYTRDFMNNKIPPYKSVEWQAKALCAEVMIPYNESMRMNSNQIIETYTVSKAFAEKRRKLN